ncbi:hypothetical protein KUTeg_015335 [Tegillarca granosa]|uniref:V-type proton ATPase subunit a n=1 Tax=Tegillarca granosa TaxID=220873 RepID=A0ABQ9EPT7_TEGGR|nr:hypothetical protein KUTeg_015335 [Tegillarca granosa]
MGSMFRSEEMTLCQLFLQSEAAYTCVSELGELGLVQFRDLNPDVNAFQRKFVNEVRRCDEMERKLRFLEKEIKKDGIPMLDTGDNPDAPAPREMIDLEATFEKLENEMKEVNANSEALKRNFLELTELKHILRKTQTFFEEAELHHTQAMHDPSLTEESLGLLGEDIHRGQALKLGFVAGVILREKIPAFERMLWRGDQVNKSVFIIFFQGEQLKTRVKKICEGLVLGQTQDHRHRVLVAAARNIKVWFIKVRKIKAIYYSLNMFNLDVTQKCLIAECWCPVADLDRIQQALRRGNERSGSSVPSILNRMVTRQEPPTYNRTNKFTQVFQSIVDAYGVASYREVNPALYTIVTFPFLFAVMFGDFGHGFIMFLFGLFLVVREKQLQAKKIEDEIFGMFFGGRYIILMMGAFSMYTGLLYNDIYSKSISIFSSSWYPIDPNTNKTYSLSTLEANNQLQLHPIYSNQLGPYPFGLDPKRYFKKPLNIFCEFIPQVVFLASIFGYLVILVFVKWVKYDGSPESTRKAPNLLIGLINMFLFQGSKDQYMFTGQGHFQGFLIFLIVICVPWMWFVKPLLLRHWHRNGQQYQPVLLVEANGRALLEDQDEVIYHDDTPSHKHDDSDDEEEEFDFGEVFIHQSIHTIEYCLGCISHTASYLRLWALSLAHAQLSEVLWGMVMRMALTMNSQILGIIILPPIFAFWAGATVVVLILMEGLSAFLHALRLHWVEFQSKFYDGSGYKFQPFSFDNLGEYGIEDK